MVGEHAAVRAALSAAAVGVWQLDDMLGRFTFDGVCAAILGLSAGPGELTVDALLRLIPEEERPPFQMRLEAAILTGQYDHSHRIQLSDGSVRWVRSLGSRVRDAGGEGLLAGILMDVTVLKDAEAAVARREESLHLLEQATDIGIYETRNDQSCTASPSFFRQLGMAPQSSFSFPEFLNRVHPEDREALVAATQSALAGSDQLRNDFRIVRADTGEVRWLSTLSQNFRDASGTASRSIGAHIDITRQKQIEEDLRGSREALATVFRQTIVGVLHRDLAHRVLVANDRFCQIVGRSAGELGGWPSKPSPIPTTSRRVLPCSVRTRLTARPSVPRSATSAQTGPPCGARCMSPSCMTPIAAFSRRSRSPSTSVSASVPMRNARTRRGGCASRWRPPRLELWRWT
jgi:PAS domain S-box-containing protein